MHSSFISAALLLSITAQARHLAHHASELNSRETVSKTVSERSSNTVPDYADASPVNVPGLPPTEHCGNNDILIMPGQPWTVANSMYGSAVMKGRQCSNFKNILQDSTGDVLVSWDSVSEVDFVPDDTQTICKGYSNIGVGVNLGHPLGDVQSIPAYYTWYRPNADGFKGTFIRS